DVLHPHLPGHAALAGCPEHLDEVVRLAGVDDIERQVGAELFGPVPDGRHVGGGVQVPAGTVDQDQGRYLALVVGLVDPDYQRSLRLLGDPRLTEPLDERLQHVGDVGLAVPDVEVHTQVGEVLPLSVEGDGAHVLPQCQIPGPFAL